MTAGAGAAGTPDDVPDDAAEDAALFFPPFAKDFEVSTEVDTDEEDERDNAELAALDTALDDAEDFDDELLDLELMLLEEERGFTGKSSSGGADLHAARVTAHIINQVRRNLL